MSERSGPPNKPTIPPRPKERMKITACLETKDGFKKMIELPDSRPVLFIQVPIKVKLYNGETSQIREIVEPREFYRTKAITPHFFWYKEQ